MMRFFFPIRATWRLLSTFFNSRCNSLNGPEAKLMRSDLEMIDGMDPANIRRCFDLACPRRIAPSPDWKPSRSTAMGLEIWSWGFEYLYRKSISVLEQNIRRRAYRTWRSKLWSSTGYSCPTTIRRPDLFNRWKLLRILVKNVIITFPNFGHWPAGTPSFALRKAACRVSDFLPYNWYDTPNITFLPFKGFWRRLCREKDIKFCAGAAVDEAI